MMMSTRSEQGDYINYLKTNETIGYNFRKRVDIIKQIDYWVLRSTPTFKIQGKLQIEVVYNMLPVLRCHSYELGVTPICII